VGQRGHNKSRDYNFSTAKEMKIINWEQDSLYKIENIEMGGACSTYGEGGGVYRVLVRKPEGKRPLGRPRHRWEEMLG
jgi:hypothetical protein